MFVGREAELVALRERLESRRFVTLLGVGGVGKSCLARELGRRSGTWRFIFCDLSAARTEEDVFVAVAAGLELGMAVAVAPVARIDAIGRALAARSGDVGCVLVLDDAEAVAPLLTPIVLRWLDVTPKVHVLVTSRVRLGAEGEQVVGLEPLRTESEAGPSEAEQLYVERARAAGATLSADDLPAVRALVRAVDGIPLAIELVAARARLFPASALLTRVEAGLELEVLGEEGSRRHLTMRSAIAGSWDLLDPAAQEGLLACSCFRGGFSAESAEAVMAPRGLDLLVRLADASLIQSTPTAEGGARFSLFRAVQAFAAQRLRERPELEETLFSRHAAHMASAARVWREAAKAAGGVETLRTFGREHDNLTLALTRLLDRAPLSGDGATNALTIVTLLEPIRMLRGHAETYVRWLRATLAAVGPSGSSPRLDPLILRAILCEGRALLELGVVDESREAFGRALALAKGARDDSAEGYARAGLARLDAHAGSWEEALLGFREAKVCAVRARDTSLLQIALASDSFYGSELRDGEEHLVVLGKAAAHFHEIGDERESLFWSVQLGRAYADFDRLDKSQAQLTSALSRAKAIGDRRSEGFASFALGGLFMSREDLEQAAARYQEAIEILAEVGKERDRGYALGYLGVVEHMRGRLDAAEAAYAAGCEVLATVGDEPNHALFTLFWAGLLADEDNVGEAAAKLAFARAGVERWVGTGARGMVLLVMSAMLEACRARAAWAQKDVEGFAAHRAAATRALRQCLVRPEKIDSAREAYDWRDVSLDVRAAYRLARRAVERLDTFRVPSACLVVESGCTRVRLGADGPWVDLRSRHVPRRLLERLVAERLTTPGSVVSASALVEAGWPGQNVEPRAATNRLHVTLVTLRQLGFAETLEHVSGGWRLRVDVPVLRAEELGTSGGRAPA